MSDALTQKDSMSRLMVEPVQGCRRSDSEVRQMKRKPDEDRNKVGKYANPRWREKPLNVKIEGARTANRRRWARRES